jgi:elongation factor P--(R)-beta-lysine ligase
MFLESISRLQILQDRAHMMGAVRSFFSQREVLEVDVPLLYRGAPIDAHIDLVQASCGGEKTFLHSSPEFGMKRLLCEGVGDCFQLSHVFRDFELGNRHNPEFSIVEWYRLGFALQELMQECYELVKLFLPEIPEKLHFLPYKQAFLDYVGHFPVSLEERDYLFAFEIESHLGQQKLTFITEFPPEQAALARTFSNGKEIVAARFEMYYKGIELANGYHELCDSQEQLRRFEQENQLRQELGKDVYPIDEDFLSALKVGLPDCCGVAVGFDRLMMLRHQTEEIHDVIPFSWRKNEAAVS